jgi:hypothetical protein
MKMCVTDTTRRVILKSVSDKLATAFCEKYGFANLSDVHIKQHDVLEVIMHGLWTNTYGQYKDLIGQIPPELLSNRQFSVKNTETGAVLSCVVKGLPSSSGIDLELSNNKFMQVFNAYFFYDKIIQEHIDNVLRTIGEIRMLLDSAEHTSDLKKLWPEAFGEQK